jgi:hypothetical protein
LYGREADALNKYAANDGDIIVADGPECSGIATLSLRHRGG